MTMMALETTRNRLDDRIAQVIIILMAIGTVFVFSASTDLGQELNLKRFYAYPGLRQIIFFPVACLVMFVVGSIDHRRLSFARGLLKSFTPYLLMLSLALLALVLLPSFGTQVHGARRWIRIPVGPASVSFQPSELAKWATIFFLAAVCDDWDFQIRSFWRQFVPVCLVLGIVVGLVVIEDFGTAAFIALLGFLMLMIGGAKWWHLLSPLPLAGMGFYFMLHQAPYRLRRLAAFLNPDEHAGSTAYQAVQSLVALGSGGIGGKGLGRGICKYGHLPEDNTDFVFSIIGEEIGLVGTLSVILLFIVLVWLGILVVVRSQSSFSRMLAAGIVLAISIQAALNIGVVTVVLPTKGIPLPFLSGGGTSLLLSAAAIGVLLNIAKQAGEQAAE